MNEHQEPLAATTQEQPIPGSAGAQLATTDAAENGSIRTLIESNRFKNAVASALPVHLKPDRFVRVALTALTRTPKLAQCDQASFFQALMTLSQFGLEPDGRNAHLIPFENRKRGVMECQLIVDYKGLVDLAMRSGKIAYIHADKVCANDKFEYDRGEIKTHRIDFKQPRGDAYAYYAICRFKDETEKCEVMTKDEVEKIRARSRAGQSGPWVTDFDEMAKKTVFRRLSKWLQLSPEYRDALDIDADALEDHRFSAALPAIARPVDLPPAAVASTSETVTPNESTPAAKKKRAKKESVPQEPAPPNGYPVVSTAADQIEAKLKEAGYKPEELIRVAITNNWCETTTQTIVGIGHEKLNLFLKKWDDMLAELQTQRDKKPTDKQPFE